MHGMRHPNVLIMAIVCESLFLSPIIRCQQTMGFAFMGQAKVERERDAVKINESPL
jgi:hypothetical protein